MPLPLIAYAAIAAGAKAAEGGFKWYAGEKRAKRDRKSIGRFQSGFAQQSPAELEYAKLLQTRMKEGALPVAQLEQQVGQRVGEFAQQGQAAVSGQMYNIGLGGTAASASAVGRVQAKALQAIAEQSRAIRIENELTKIAAGDQYGRYGAGRSSVLRQMALTTLQGETGISGNLESSRTAAVGDVTSAAGQFAAWQGSQSGQSIVGDDGITYNYVPGKGWVKAGQ